MALAEQVLDAFRCIRDLRLEFYRDSTSKQTQLNEHQQQINHLRQRIELVEKRQDARPLPDGCEYPDCGEPLTGKAEGAMSHVTRPADDDASEWSDPRFRAYRGGA